MTERVLRGRWWRADRTYDTAVPGLLTLSEGSDVLEIEGSMLDEEYGGLLGPQRDSVEPVPRILGECNDGTAVTAEGSRLYGWRVQGSNEGKERIYETWRPRVVCLGSRFPADEPLAFDSVQVRLSSLHAWTAVSGFEPHWQAAKGSQFEPVTQTYTAPASRVARLHDGTEIILEFPLVEQTRGLYTYEKTFTQATRFRFEFPKPRHVNDVQRLIFQLRNLITLGVGEAVKVVDLRGYRKPLPSDPLPVGRSVEVVYQHIENPHARDLEHHHFMVFVLSDIDDRFEEQLVRWFEVVPELGRVLDLYFSTIHTAFTFLETRFMNFAQAVEGYHRRRLDRPPYDEETFNLMQETILEPLAGRVRKLAKRVLRHANEQSLEQRLRESLEFVEEAGRQIASSSAMTVPLLAQRIAETRNVYAHNLAAEPSREELVMLTDQLSVLLEALLLREFGFDSQAISEKLERARRFELISHWRRLRD